MNVRLEGDIAIVAGAGGIGKAIIKGLIQNGARVIISDINLERARRVINEDKLPEDRALTIEVDAGDSNQVTRMVQTVLDNFGKIDILVNTVGILRESPIAQTTEIEWDETLQVNLKSAFNLCKAVIPSMIKRRKGKIVNFASIAGQRGSALSVHYGASKAGIIGFTKSLAREIGRYGINVNAIAPGIIRTEMSKKKVTEERAKYLSQILLGRFGEPEDVVGVVLLLVSEEGNYITSQIINVDGGTV